MNPIEIKKKGKGRNKIEIKLIDKEANRQVCFSKRRKGLFKKANELCNLCGAEVAIIVFSIAGRPYSFGHPSVDHVLQRLINVPLNPSEAQKALFWWDMDFCLMGMEELREYEKVLLQLQSRCNAPEAVMGQIEGSSMAEVGEEDHLLLQLLRQNYEFAECD